MALADDDTGQPLKLDGCVTQLMSPFTSASWLVSFNNVVTQCFTTLTIPVFPITSASLLSLSFTISPGLSVAPGTSFMIADASTGLNYMYGYVLSYSPTTGVMTVQVGMSFLFEIRRGGEPKSYNGGPGYVPYYDWGSPGKYGPLLQATNGNGVAITDIGFIQILIPASSMQRLRGGTYSAALIMSDSVNTREIFIGQLPILHGDTSRMPLQSQNTGYNPNIF